MAAAEIAVLDADGTRLPYRLFPAVGEERGAVVHLHGIQSHGGWYVETAEALAQRGYTVFLTDRRGSGASDEPRGDFDSPEQLVEDVGRFVALARAHGPVFLAGGCWGARPAVEYALEHQDELAGLVLVCPALKAQVDLTAAQKARVATRRGRVPVPLAPELFTNNPERVEYIRRDPLSLREVTAGFFFEQAKWDRKLRKATGLDLPVLLLQAGDDPIVDREWVQGWFTRLRSADKTYRLYPDSGHILDFEPDPSEYRDDFASWLDSRTNGRPGRGPSVARVEVLTADLPFRFSFGHALAARKETTNVLVRLTLSDGTVGWGEGVPREYVTGETAETAVDALREELVRELLGRDVGDVRAALAEVPFGDPELDHAARCALELATLDAVGHREGRSVQDYLGGGRVPFVRYDAVIPFSSPRKLKLMAAAIRALAIDQVKIKVGADLDDDLATLELLRATLGGDVDIRVDANCAWDADEALRAIERMRAYRISSVEQPVPGTDLDGMRAVTAATDELIIADESLRSIEEARELAETGACDAFNIRVSKCGGLLPSLEIARIASHHGLVCIVGAQVGESGILSAAGRHLAAAIAPRYVEGSGGSLLLKQDLTEERVVPGRHGLARPHTGPGLGVTVNEQVVKRYSRVVADLGR